MAGLLPSHLVTAASAYVHVCPAAQASASVTSAADLFPLAKPVLAIAPGGVQFWLSIGPRPLAQCDNVRIGVDAKNVIAIHSVVPSLMREHGNELHLSGTAKNGAMTIHAITGKDRPRAQNSSAERFPAPLAENLLGHINGRAFGIEARARLTSGPQASLALHCDAGYKPAGVVLQVPWYLPQADLTLELAGSGHGKFAVGLIDRTLETKQDALAIGAFDPAAGSIGMFRLPLTGVTRSAWRALSLSCPEAGGSLELRVLQFLPIPALIPAPGRATWVWKSDDWKYRSASVLAHAERHDMNTLYVTVGIRSGAVEDPAALAAFVTQATSRGLAVWPVDGDPKMVLSTEHAATVQRVDAYVAYNRGVDATARLQGLQFDIEPYLLPNADAAPDVWERQYLRLAAALRGAAGTLPLEMVVPYWWGTKTAFLDALAPFVDSVNVMDYRTRADEIYRFAVPFLDWGARHGKKVRIALEAGPVAAEAHWSCKKEEQGNYWLVPIKDMTVLLALKNPQRNPHGPAFSQREARVIASDATTFHGKQGSMMPLVRQLEARFSAWGAFSGMAMHELDR